MSLMALTSWGILWFWGIIFFPNQIRPYWISLLGHWDLSCDSILRRRKYKVTQKKINTEKNIPEYRLIPRIDPFAVTGVNGMINLYP